MQKMNLFRRLAQSTLEYTLLVSIVAAAVVAMHLYAQRSVRSAMKLIEEQINAEPVDSLGR